MATKHASVPETKAKPPIRVAKKKASRNLGTATQVKILSVATLRKSFGVNRKIFARLTGYSERAVAQWESGTVLRGASLQRMNEMDRLHQALTKVIKPDFVPQWLQLPNDAFGGFKPMEIVERGEVDRIWRMIYKLESGIPG